MLHGKSLKIYSIFGYLYNFIIIEGPFQNIFNKQLHRLKMYSRPQTQEHCEVSSSVGPYLPSVEGPSSSNWTPKPEPWEIPKHYESGDIWSEGPWGSMTNGVIVDPIKTYHMGVALATRQTPFALLKPDSGTPVLVKVVDTKLPGGKQVSLDNFFERFCSSASRSNIHLYFTALVAIG